MTDEDAEERRQLAAALAALKALKKAGYPPDLASELAELHQPLILVVSARPPKRRGVRRVLQWMWSLLYVVTFDMWDAAERMRGSRALENNHRALFDGSHALETAIAGGPEFASTRSACAAMLQPRRIDEDGKLLGAGVADYLVCVFTNLLSSRNKSG